MSRKKTGVYVVIILMIVLVITGTGCTDAFPRYTVTIVSEGPGTVELQPIRSWYWWGSVVSITALADAGALFTGWTGDAVGTSDQLVFSIYQDTSITANFAPEATCILSLEWDAPEEKSVAIRGTEPSTSRVIPSTQRAPVGDWESITWVDDNANVLQSSTKTGIIVRYDVATTIKSRDLSASPAYERIEVSGGTGELDALLESYRQRSDVLYAEPEKVWSAHGVPNDPYYSYQWNMHMLSMEAVWEVSKAQENIIVAVLDTGVWNALDDLSGTPFVPGYDFVNRDPVALDDNGHGSHVAGTIAQSTNNGVGVAGMAYGVSIMPVKVLGADGNGTDTMVGEGIYYAVDHGARIINMSLGGSYSRFVEEACDYARSRGVLVVASAGNDGIEGVRYPAAYDSVMAVGAVDDSGNRATYSNYGEALEIMAPGGDNSRRIWNEVEQKEHSGGVLQQSVNAQGVGEYRYYAGTSMAAPHVSALAALLLSRNSSMTGADARTILCNTATDDTILGWDSGYGHGLLNPLAALGVVGYPMTFHDTAGCALVPGESLWWSFSVFPSEVRASVQPTVSMVPLDTDIKMKLVLADDNGQVLAESDPQRVGEMLQVMHTVTSVQRIHAGIVVVNSGM